MSFRCSIAPSLRLSRSAQGSAVASLLAPSSEKLSAQKMIVPTDAPTLPSLPAVLLGVSS